jgi:hypothetical protein
VLEPWCGAKIKTNTKGKSNTKTNTKSSGQECPLYTCLWPDEHDCGAEHAALMGLLDKCD